MKLKEQIKVAFAFLISHPVTNPGRQADSDPDSVENRTNIESFVTHGGWSDDYPAVVVDMADRWPFTYDPNIRPDGMTDLEFIAKDMVRRRKLKDDIWAMDSDDKPTWMQAFEDIYTEEYEIVETVDGVAKSSLGRRLIELTVENSKWVHSGHQRTQFVFFPSYVQYLKRKRADIESNATPETARIKYDKYKLEVPCNVKTFIDMRDIIIDQVAMNQAQLGVNRLKILDLTKTVIELMGNGIAPALTESDFRNYCAEPGNTTQDGLPARGGAIYRLAYHLGECNFSHEFHGNLWKSLTASKKKKDEATGKEYDNPDYIPVGSFNDMSKDPAWNPSVIARLLEPGLGKLKKYAAEWGENGSRNKDKPSKLSAMEQVVLDRDYSWTKEEKSQWLAKRKPANTLMFAPPIKEAPEEKFDPKTLETVATAQSFPLPFREYLGAKLGVKVPVEGKPAYLPDAQEVQDSIMARRDIYNFIHASDVDSPVMQMIGALLLVRNGNPDGFNKLVDTFQGEIDAAVLAGPAPSGGSDSGDGGNDSGEGQTSQDDSAAIVVAEGTTVGDPTVPGSGVVEQPVAVPGTVVNESGDVAISDAPAAVEAVEEPAHRTRKGKGGRKG